MDPPKFSPGMHLFLFTLMQFLTYFDRGAFSILLQPIKNAYDLATPQLGLIGSIFTLGFMIACPIVAVAGQRSHPRCIGVGLLCWSAGTILTGLLPGSGGDYGLMLFSRTLTGVGEAGFCCLAPPIIDDTAPQSSRGLYLAIFYMFMFAGQASGYILGGAISDALGGQWGTVKYIFAAEGLVMLPLAAVPSLLPKRFITPSSGRSNTEDFGGSAAHGEVRTRRSGTAGSFTELAEDHAIIARTISQQGGFGALVKKSGALFKNPVYMNCLLAYSAYQFVVGGVGYWGPYYVESCLQMSKSKAGLCFGGVTVISGVVGTWAGSFLLDREASGSCLYPASRLLRASRLSCLGAGIAWPFLVLTATAPNYLIFFGSLFCGQFFLFAMYTPVTTVLMESVPTSLRGGALGLSALAIHLLGDVPSQALVGEIAKLVSDGDESGPLYVRGLHVAMICLVGWQFFCLTFFLVTTRLVSKRLEPSGSLADQLQFPQG